MVLMVWLAVHSFYCTCNFQLYCFSVWNLHKKILRVAFNRSDFYPTHSVSLCSINKLANSKVLRWYGVDGVCVWVIVCKIQNCVKYGVFWLPSLIFRLNGFSLCMSVCACVYVVVSLLAVLFSPFRFRSIGCSFHCLHGRKCDGLQMYLIALVCMSWLRVII